jgi:DNA-binding NarL/FixJ family response regulator
MTPGMAASWNGPRPPCSYSRAVALRCVIIDDSPGFLRAARALLEQEGLHVVGVASTGSEGVRCTADLHPDVTLLDIGLGAESGFDVARRLMDDPSADPGQVILISAQAQDDFVDLIEASPAVGFLVKPALSVPAIERLLRPTGAAGHGAGETVAR